MRVPLLSVKVAEKSRGILLLQKQTRVWVIYKSIELCIETISGGVLYEDTHNPIKFTSASYGYDKTKDNRDNVPLG